MRELEPVTLDGRLVRLEPLRTEHCERLYEIGSDPEIWRWTTTQIGTRSDMDRYVDEAMAEFAAGTALPFVTIDKRSGSIVGSTRFGRIKPEHRTAEIGWTWIAPAWQRTYINTEAKFLMLAFAFEEWKCIRVEIITDVNNERSRRAIRRIGATEEGVLRNHLIVDSGRIRDSVVYSIIDAQWPNVRRVLEQKLLEER